MLGSTLLPEMYRRGYRPAISIGPIVAVGGLAMLIPPSALAVLLGSIAQIPISGLLVGAVIPALILAALFVVYILVRCRLNPELAPPCDVGDLSRRERIMPFLEYVLPLLSIFVVIVGSIVGGIATPPFGLLLFVIRGRRRSRPPCRRSSARSPRSSGSRSRSSPSSSPSPG